MLNGRSTDASSGWTGGGLSATTIISSWYPFINGSNYSTPPDWRIQYRTQEFIKCNQQSNLKMFKIMLNKSRPRPSDIKTSLGRSLPLPVWRTRWWTLKNSESVDGRFWRSAQAQHNRCIFFGFLLLLLLTLVTGSPSTPGCMRPRLTPPKNSCAIPQPRIVGAMTGCRQGHHWFCVEEQTLLNLDSD